MESVKLKNSIIYYYGTPTGYLKDGKANLDSSFLCDELKNWCQEKRLEPCFSDGIFEVLAQKEDVSQFMKSEESLKNVRIWQLNADSDFSMRFISFHEFKESCFAKQSKRWRIVLCLLLPFWGLDF